MWKGLILYLNNFKIYHHRVHCSFVQNLYCDRVRAGEVKTSLENCLENCFRNRLENLHDIFIESLFIMSQPKCYSISKNEKKTYR